MRLSAGDVLVVTAAAAAAVRALASSYDGGVGVGVVSVQVLSQRLAVDVRASEDTADIQFGFEGGRVVALPPPHTMSVPGPAPDRGGDNDDGELYIFTAEMFDAPADAAMRCAVWSRPMGGSASSGSRRHDLDRRRVPAPAPAALDRSTDAPLGWRRRSTIATSNQTFPLSVFKQQCNQQWCPWSGASPSTIAMELAYDCDTSDLHASPWAPAPIFDAVRDRWVVLYVGYGCDGTELVTAGVGNIFAAQSATAGRAGAAGPWIPLGIVLGPNATDEARRWGDAGRGPKYVDQISLFQLPNGTYAAFIGSVSTWLATADSPTGPFRVSTTPVDPDVFNRSPLSAYNENPIVSVLPWGPGGAPLYVAVLDTVFNEHAGFGLTTSTDGLRWSPAQDIPIAGGCRTPLGLLDAGPGRATLVFTRRFQDCRNRVQQDDCGGFGMAMPTMCANIYEAELAVRVAGTLY